MNMEYINKIVQGKERKIGVGIIAYIKNLRSVFFKGFGIH